MSKKPVLIYFLVILILGYSWSKWTLDERLRVRGEAADIRYLPTPKLAEIMSFGFEPAMADLYWIEGINYYGAELVSPSKSYKYLSSYCDLILNLDPYFGVFYDWASTAFIYTGLPITREAIVRSTEFANAGIINLNRIYRYEPDMIIKGAFNYALESHAFVPSLDYFELAGRLFPEKRDMLLVGSTYAAHANDPARSAAMKLEYLGDIAFEASNAAQLRYAINVLSSDSMNTKSAEFIRSLRLKMETDEDVRKLVEQRLANNPVMQNAMLSSRDLFADPRLDRILSVDHTRSWLPVEMLVLFSL